jgi:hypothetical protein
VFAEVILWGVTLGEEPLILDPEILGERGRGLRLPSMTGGFSTI